MKAIRTWSEISYGLEETKYGVSPKTRRFYKQRLAKVRRAIDKAAIVEGMPQAVQTSQRGEWTVIEDPCMKDLQCKWMWFEWDQMRALRAASIDASMRALRKQIQTDSMWHNHTL